MNCPVCNTFIEDKHFIRKYISEFNNKEYKLYHCTGCSLEFWIPLQIIPEFYEKESLDLYKSLHFGREFLSVHHRPFFKYFPLRKGKLLDIGCGDGIFLKEAEKKGFEVWGIDFDKKSIETAKRKFNLASCGLRTLARIDFICN